MEELYLHSPTRLNGVLPYSAFTPDSSTFILHANASDSETISFLQTKSNTLTDGGTVSTSRGASGTFLTSHDLQLWKAPFQHSLIRMNGVQHRWPARQQESNMFAIVPKLKQSTTSCSTAATRSV
jgi:hypothetical protein